MHKRQIQATEPDWIRSTIDKYRSWIQSALGVSIEQAIILEVDNNFTSLAIPQTLPGVPLATMERRSECRAVPTN
jgi:hypothetical protein